MFKISFQLAGIRGVVVILCFFFERYHLLRRGSRALGLPTTSRASARHNSTSTQPMIVLVVPVWAKMGQASSETAMAGKRKTGTSESVPRTCMAVRVAGVVGRASLNADHDGRRLYRVTPRILNSSFRAPSRNAGAVKVAGGPLSFFRGSPCPLQG